MIHLKPDLLCIGFACHDLHQNKNILGGTASYSGIMASNLGMKTALLTSVGEDFEFFPVFDEYSISLYNKASEKTTVFENIYREGSRTQYIYHRAATLYPSDLPKEWLDAPVVKFCLIADEADPSFLSLFPNALVGATIQGWLRQWDKTGKISPKEMDWELLQAVDIVFMSEDDIIGYESAIPKISELVDVLVMTQGRNGAVVFNQGKQTLFPSFPVTEVDPTGAGDIFASSFLFKYNETRSIPLSAAFAHAAASYIVEDYGIKIPSVAAVEQRFEDYLARFPTG